MEQLLYNIQKAIYEEYKEKKFHVNIALFDIDESILFAKNYYPDIADYEKLITQYNDSIKQGELSPYIIDVLQNGELRLTQNQIALKLNSAIDLFILKLFENSECQELNYFRIGTHEQKIGLITILSKSELDTETNRKLKESTQQKLIIPFLEISRTKFKQEKEKVISHARKAAIAQVMLRNMSHNLGSHVLANLTQPRTILEIALGNNSPSFTTYENNFKQQLIYKNGEGKEINTSTSSKSFTVAISELFSYLRTRMDFLADISTGTAVIETTKQLVNDVLEPFRTRNILLKEYITGNKKRVIIYKPDSKLIAAFPNDNLGVQALYVIIENVIRNSAKHSKGNCNVSINWEYNIDNYAELIELSIYDKNDPKDPEALKDLVSRQNERIVKEILDNGVLRHGSWGMLEMKIAAAYLRKIPVEKIDEYHKIPLLKAVSVPEREEKYLGYKFYLLKPKHVLILVKSHENVVLNDDFEQHGINLKTLTDVKAPIEAFGHDLLLLVDCKKNDINKIRKLLPERVISSNIETLMRKSKESAPEFINWLWKEWFDKLLVESNPVVLIKAGDDNGNQPVEVKLIGNSRKIPTKAEFVYHCKTFRENAAYFEPYSSLYPAKNQLDKLIDTSPFELKGRFLEAINFTVAIVDERIQKHSEISFDGGIAGCIKKHIDFLEKCGIYLPAIEIDLNAETFNKKVGEQTIKEKLKVWYELKAKECTFLVIHIGIIERLLELDRIKDEEKLNKIEEFLSVLRQIQNLKAKIIIISGRGQPETLPKGERFVHYSNIAQYIIEKRSKFHLIQLLMSARETK